METEQRYKRTDLSDEPGGISGHDGPANRLRGASHQEERMSSSSSRTPLVRWQECVSSSIALYANTSRVRRHPSHYSIALLHAPHPQTCSLLYCVFCLLDALDCSTMRYFAYKIQFGAVLDMVTDRCTTSCLVVFQQARSQDGALSFKD